jgi:ribonuclease T2
VKGTMDRLVEKRYVSGGCALFVLAVLALSACSRNQVTSLEPPRNPEPVRSPSTQPRHDAGAASAANHPESEPEATIDAGPSTGRFDFYVLALSWAPEFCASQSESKSVSECDPSRHYGFVVHGLWPQNDDGTYPVSCMAAMPVPNDILSQMLPIMPARGLVQHEWATHGTCSGLSSREYFWTVQRAFGNLNVPDEYQHPTQAAQASPKEIEQEFAAANGAPADSFRVACSKGELVGVDACLTKDLKYRSCGKAVRECRARQVNVVPAN